MNIVLSSIQNVGGVAWELLKMIAYVIERLTLYNTDEPEITYWKLQSAFDHLAKGVSQDLLGLPYLDRIHEADPVVLKVALDTFGYSQSDIDRWQALYGHLSLANKMKEKVAA